MANNVLEVIRYSFFEDDNADPDAVTQVAGLSGGDPTGEGIAGNQ